jgi:diguanylate cyclase (GGDEF)-like protein/PAS domain S-box-containing protein
MHGLALLMGIGIANAFRSLAAALDEKEVASALTVQHERRFRALVQSSHDLVFVIDADSAVTYASPSCTEVLGYDPVQLLGNRTGGLIHADEERALRDVLGRTARTPGASTEFSMRIRHLDGAWRTLEGVATNLLDDDAVLGLVINARDVTDRRLRLERQAAVATLGREALAMTALEPLVQTCAATVVEILDAQRCRILDVFEDPIEIEAYAPADVPQSQLVVPVGDPAQPVARIEVAADHELGTDEHQFVDSIAGILLASIIRARAEDAIRHQALHDPLTGLPNRTLFNDRLEQALMRRVRSGGYLAVMIVDLDGFKTVNDSLGHLTGDALLVAVSHRFATTLRDLDTVARLGGDEFAILVDDLDAPDQAGRVAQRVLDALALPLQLADRTVGIGASIGITVAHQFEAAPEVLLSNADAAMYRAKRLGGNRCEFYEHMMRSPASMILSVQSELHRALERDEFFMLYQPLVSLATGEVTGAEALVRWRHPQRGILAPKDFLALAESSGLIVPIGKQIISQACHQARSWQTERPGRDALQVNINLSPLEFLQPELVQTIAEVLEATGVVPALIGLEITESAIMEDIDATASAMQELKELGVGLIIDDFGTGYSSLTHLKRFPVDELKVDRSFVAGLGEGGKDAAIVNAVIALAHSLELTAVAEGVETPDQRQRLRDLGCDVGQGYFFGRPGPADALFSGASADPAATLTVRQRNGGAPVHDERPTVR